MNRWSLDLSTLKTAYAAGTLTPYAVVEEVYRRIAEAGERPVWITLQPKDAALARVATVEARRAAGEDLPLYGIPCAVKDIIDVAGLPTTAACPDFAYTPERSAAAVERLEAAGAIIIGKTNLDQFATGLVGTRSPYGACSSVFDPNYISGGSSSGSAVAVAAGLVSVALGTDTAGSGRVPAAFNNIVGVKPTKGLVSTRGMVAACRTLDCLSVFAGTVADGMAVLSVIEGYDAADPYARDPDAACLRGALPVDFRFGVPAEGLQFFGDDAAAGLYEAAIQRLRNLGGIRVDIDFAPFRAAAELLYQGPWVAERLASLRSHGYTRWEAMDKNVAEIIRGAESKSAADAFDGVYRLAACTRAAQDTWARIDVLLLPTAGTIYRIDAVEADPIGLNSTLGLYTNFVNLMDLAAIAVPAGFRPDGLPCGVTLIGPAYTDRAVAGLADRLHRALPGATIGATGVSLPDSLYFPPPSDGRVGVPARHPVRRAGTPALPATDDTIALAVVGAHLSGQPLNGQLTGRGATLLRTTRTAPGYRLYALADIVPAKPGLVRDATGAGLIEVEVWAIDAAHFGSFVAEIPAPLGIGTLTLEDGTQVTGFICEPYGLEGARDITGLGGWRAWLATISLEQGA